MSDKNRIQQSIWLLLVISTILAGCASKPSVTAVNRINVPEYYTVQSGDSLSKIAARYGLYYPDIAALNNIAVMDKIWVGQRLRLHAADSASIKSSGLSKNVSPTFANGMPSTQIPTNSGIQTAWRKPSTNRLIADFNLANNQKGWFFGGQMGDPVIAAADGEVIYVGSGVRDYGQLVLLQHANGLITAYAHNSRIVVKSGEQVRAGQKIAEMGQNDAGQTMLQFQVRQDGKAINPAQVIAIN